MFSQFFVSALFAAFFPVQTFLCCSWECVLSFFSPFVYPVACLLAVLVFSVSLAAAMSDSTAATSRSKVHLKLNDLRVSQN